MLEVILEGVWSFRSALSFQPLDDSCGVLGVLNESKKMSVFLARV